MPLLQTEIEFKTDFKNFKAVFFIGFNFYDNCDADRFARVRAILMFNVLWRTSVLCLCTATNLKLQSDYILHVF